MSLRAIVMVLGALAAGLALTPARATTLGPDGGTDGTVFSDTCPDGAYLAGLSAVLSDRVQNLQPVCAAWAGNSFAMPALAGSLHGATQPSAGGLPAVPPMPTQRTCPQQSGIKHVFMTFIRDDAAGTTFVNEISLTCHPVTASDTDTAGDTIVCFDTGDRCMLQLGNGYAGEQCPNGEIANGIDGRADTALHAFGVLCAAAPTAGVTKKPLVTSQKDSGAPAAGNGPAASSGAGTGSEVASATPPPSPAAPSPPAPPSSTGGPTVSPDNGGASDNTGGATSDATVPGNALPSADTDASSPSPDNSGEGVAASNGAVAANPTPPVVAPPSPPPIPPAVTPLPPAAVASNALAANATSGGGRTDDSASANGSGSGTASASPLTGPSASNGVSSGGSSNGSTVKPPPAVPPVDSPPTPASPSQIAAINPTLPAPPTPPNPIPLATGVAVTCVGGAGMTAVASADGTVRIPFTPAAATSPQRGQCALSGRGFRAGDPSVLVFAAGQTNIKGIVQAVSSGTPFQVHARDDGQGSLVVTSIDPLPSAVPPVVSAPPGALTSTVPTVVPDASGVITQAVAVTDVNIRSGPSITSPATGVLQGGASVVVAGCGGGWCQIVQSASPRSGFVGQQFLRMIGPIASP